MRARTITWAVGLVKGFLLGLALFGAIAAGALSPSDRNAVTKALDAEAKALRDEGTELRQARKLVEATFSNPRKPDVFAFMTLEAAGGANSYATYLFVLSDKGRGYAVMASSPVGGAIQRIENGYVEIQGRDVLLRSDELADADNENAFGEDKVYYRWRIDGSHLKRVGGLWLKRGAAFVEVKLK